MSKTIASWCLALLFLPAAGWGAEEKVTIRHAWPPGKYVMTVTNQSDGTTTVAGEKVPSKDSSRQVWQMVVPAAEKDEKKVTLQLSEAKTEGEEGGEAYRFDSSGQGQQKGELAFVFKPLMSATVSATLDADDTVVEVSGLDKLWNALAEKAQTPEQKSVVAEFKISLGDKSFETNFRRLESVIPKSPVAVGDTWKAGLRIDLPVVGEIKARYDCKLAAVENAGEGQIAVIEATSKYSLANPKTVEMEGAKVTLTSIEMDEQATLRVSLKTGLIASDESTRTVTTVAKTTQEGKEIEIGTKSVTKSKTTVAPAGKEQATPGTQQDSKPAEKPNDQPPGDTGQKPSPPAAATPGSGGPAAGTTPPGLPPLIGQPNAATPPWVKEGVRIVYYCASGRMPGPASFYRDETGDWVDKNGIRYTQEGATGGNGLSQLDVLAVDGSNAVVSFRNWSYAGGTGPLYPIGTNGQVFQPGESEWWINPAVLRELPTTPLGELKIVRGPYKILRTGKVFDNTVVIRSEKPDSRIQHVYDAETGMLLHMDSSVRERDGSQGVGRIDFVALRSVRLPSLGTAPPDWFGRFSGLAYQGTRTVEAPNIPVSTMPTASRATVLRKGGTWALLKIDASTQLPGGLTDSNQVQIVSGANQVGAFWIHPDVLRQLRTGQVLDQDETTGTRVAVGPVGNGMVVINETGQAHNYNFGYDLATGTMTAETLINNQTYTRVDLQCTQRGE